MIKICNVCGQEKEHKAWKSTTCNECLDSGLKYCTKCKQIYPITNFHKNGNTIRSYCKNCENERSMKSKEASGYYQRPEVKAKRNEDSRLHKKAMYMFDEDYRINELIRCHERRKQTGVNKLSTEEWLEALERFNYSCAYCGSNTKLSMDHIIPISIGGTNEASNIIPACSSCNSSKQASDMVEWYTTQVFYSKKRLENIIKYSKSRR